MSWASYPICGLGKLLAESKRRDGAAEEDVYCGSEDSAHSTGLDMKLERGQT